MSQTTTFDRYMTLGDLAQGMKQTVKRALLPLAVILMLAAGGLWYAKSPGTLAFALMAGGTWMSLAIWSDRALGLPMLPIFVLQHLMTYALPILVGHDVLEQYPESQLVQAGVEVLVFCLCTSVAWWMCMQTMRPASAWSYALQGFEREGMARIQRIGMTLVGAATLYQVLEAADLLHTILSLLPGGSYSVVYAVVSAVGTCGFFLVAMVIGARNTHPSIRTYLWVMFAIYCMVSAANFLLSAASIIVGAVFIGLLWSSGRVPWRYLTTVLLILSFLNLGKFVMRERYWDVNDDGGGVHISLVDMPATYAEWMEASFDIMMGKELSGNRSNRTEKKKGQNLFERVNNLQNLLFVIDSMDNGRTPPLYGATYTIIPPLLVPRFLWPDKPRAHEGQVKLNVHFGRQDLGSTYKTYVAWGLLAEAYGNFGPYIGAVVLGAFLGIFCAWLENFTTRKLMLSLEGFICFTVFLGFVGSYEMVASVLVTSVFQAVTTIVMACAPFVERQLIVRPDSA